MWRNIFRLPDLLLRRHCSGKTLCLWVANWSANIGNTEIGIRSVTKAYCCGSVPGHDSGFSPPSSGVVVRGRADPWEALSRWRTCSLLSSLCLQCPIVVLLQHLAPTLWDLQFSPHVIPNLLPALWVVPAPRHYFSFVLFSTFFFPLWWLLVPRFFCCHFARVFCCYLIDSFVPWTFFFYSVSSPGLPDCL